MCWADHAFEVGHGTAVIAPGVTNGDSGDRAVHHQNRFAAESQAGCWEPSKRLLEAQRVGPIVVIGAVPTE